MQVKNPADNVRSFPVNPNQMMSDGDESLIVEKCDLSPVRVRGFAPPHVDAGRLESTMKCKVPKNYNPVVREPTI